MSLGLGYIVVYFWGRGGYQEVKKPTLTDKCSSLTTPLTAILVVPDVQRVGKEKERDIYKYIKNVDQRMCCHLISRPITDQSSSPTNAMLQSGLSGNPNLKEML